MKHRTRPTSAKSLTGLIQPAGVAGLCRLALVLCLCILLWACQEKARPDAFISGLAASHQSAELFTLPNGVNEFDLVWAQGRYHLFYDDKHQTRHRSAPTLAELADAPDDLTLTGRYPSVLEHGGVWYLWAHHCKPRRTCLYRSGRPQGPYTLADDWSGPPHYSDWRVTRNPGNGRFYAAYKHSRALSMGVMTADTPNGPWVDHGAVFAGRGRASWHSVEEADPQIIFHGQRAYVAFAGWDGHRQRVGMVGFDPVAMKAKGPAICLVEPNRPWQNRNCQSKVFSPTWVTIPGQGPGRLFFSHNPSAPGTPSGWAYLQQRKKMGSGS